MELGERSYDIVIGSGIISLADKLLHLERRALIVTDSGVPREYAETVASLCKEARIFTFPEGEESKNLSTYGDICKEMLAFNLQRKDVIIAVGGGVTGDMAGFAAATYMRGIDFYNIPTTLLSQVDSSIGGKTAVDFCGVKNILGAFHQPKGVLIDTEVLKTLDGRQMAAGMAEVVKMALTSDKDLFSLMEDGLWKEDVPEMITRALLIKKRVVEADEREGAERRLLNFGHTLGHGIEALGGRLHGECVALGMLPMCSEPVRKRLIPLLHDIGLPTDFSRDGDSATEFMKHDKKGEGDSTYAVYVDEIGKGRIEKTPLAELVAHIKSYLDRP